MTKNRRDKGKEPDFLDFLAAYLKPESWKKTILVILIVVCVLLLVFAFEPLIWNLLFGVEVRIPPSKPLSSLFLVMI
ncbi:MAG: hypothetical protein ACFE9J_04280 [Candidatus Hermodarchaeota archaeon]